MLRPGIFRDSMAATEWLDGLFPVAKYVVLRIVFFQEPCIISRTIAAPPGRGWVLKLSYRMRTHGRWGRAWGGEAVS